MADRVPCGHFSGTDPPWTVEYVFHEVDTALRAWLHMGLPAGTEVSFDIPGKSFREQSRKRPTVNSFLYRVRQDPNRLAGNWVGVRARDGRVIGRQPPIRHYRVYYLLTAWTGDPESEHELLGTVLATLALQDTIPLPHLTGSLLEAGEPIPVTVADPEFPAASMDVWQALGIPPRGSLDLVVTTPLVPPLITDLAPAPRQLEVDAESKPRPDTPGEPAAGRVSSASEHRTRKYP